MTDLVFIIASKTPILSLAKRNRLSDICSDIGQVFFVSMVVPFFIGVDKVNISVVIWGIVGTVLAWLLSVVLADE